jgi:hypothetical protein
LTAAARLSETLGTPYNPIACAGRSGALGSGPVFGIELAENPSAKRGKKGAWELRVTAICSVQFSNFLNSPQALEGG